MISTSVLYAQSATNQRVNNSSTVSLTTIPELQQLVEYAVYLQDQREEQEDVLARKLHNLIGQSLTSIGLSVQVARQITDRDELSELLNGLQETVRLATADVRCLIRQLRPTALNDLGVEAAIQGLVRESISAGLECCFESRLRPGQRFDPAIETALFRVVQLFLQNSVRATGATAVGICLGNADNCVSLDLTANGCLIDRDPTRTESAGLQGIARRVELLQGRIEMIEQDGEFQRINIALPNSLELR